MGYHFPRIHINYVYQFIQKHEGETLLRKDFTENIPICRRTLYDALQWLKKRNFITIDGKKFYVKMH